MASEYCDPSTYYAILTDACAYIHNDSLREREREREREIMSAGLTKCCTAIILIYTSHNLRAIYPLSELYVQLFTIKHERYDS